MFHVSVIETKVIMNTEKVIECRNMYKMFGNFTANNNLSFDVFKGEVFGFLGANGAGKTTAIKILCGLLEPTSGTITVAGYNVYTQREEIKSNIGYMSQRFSLYEDLTVYENIRFFGGIYGLPGNVIKEKADMLLEKMKITEFRNRLIGDLPPGWKQRLAFSIAIIHSPSIVFLDEPTSGVDPVTRRNFWDMIYETANKGISVFITTHYMDEAEYCNRVTIMNEGKIEALDTPENLKKKFNTSSINDVFINIARNTENEKV